MSRLDPRFVDALESLRTGIGADTAEWAFTGSTGFALRGLPVEPNDIDLQTTEQGAYVIEEHFSERVVEPVSFTESAAIRSHFGTLELCGVAVEIMGDVQKRREDGTWDSPTDIDAHREFVAFRDGRVPVLSLEYEAEAYDRLGRTERARLLREYIDERG